MGTPRLKGFWAGLCIVAFCHLAFCHPVFSAQNNERNKPTLAKENATDHSLQDESREAGPTLPNPVKSKSSKKKTASYAEAPRDAAQEFPSNRTDSQPTDKLTADSEAPPFVDEIPLVTENILLAPEPYTPSCRRKNTCRQQCRQCRQCNCSHCGCAHDSYLLIDFLFFKRDNTTNGATITETRVVHFLHSQHAPQIQERHQAYVFLVDVSARMELAGSSDTPVCLACLANAQFTPPTLQIPGDLGNGVTGWTNLDAVRSTYTSSLNMCEVNLFTSETTVKGGPHSPFPWHRVHDPFTHEFQWLGGLRWAGFHDIASLQPNGSISGPGAYTITTSSQMFGPQFGFKTKRRWHKWALEGWAKATLAGTFLDSDSAPITTASGGAFQYRPQTSARDVGVGFVGDVNYSLVRRLNHRWSLRAGYNLIWLSGVALAPNQFDFTFTTASGSQLVDGGSVFLHGANLGLEACW